MKSITANLGASFNLFTLVTVILGASGALMAITNNSRLIGAALAALGVVAVPLQGWLSGLVIVIPGAAYSLALKIYAGVVAFSGAAAIINQWVLTYSPSLKGDLTFLFSLTALISTVFVQLFHISSSKAAFRSPALPPRAH
jgi:hypothetical protein